MACIYGDQAAAQERSKAELIVHTDKEGPRVSPLLYGIFFEEINCAGDGGLYAELVRNRSFEDDSRPEHWAVVGNAVAVVEDNSSGQEFNKRALRLTVPAGSAERGGVANEGYWGVPVEKGKSYECTLHVRPAHGFAGPLWLELQSRDGRVYAREKVPLKSGDKNRTGEGWTSLKTSLKSSATDPSARFVVALGQPGTVLLDFVSLFPQDTWRKRPNGLRPDLAQMLEGLKPAFVRFPGGCWVEGDTLALSYRWKQTIGPLPGRRTHYNIWRYNSTHGLGYHEYLQMCEDLRAKPLFVVNCGMSHRENVPMSELGPWVQDALDAIEYANGPVTSTWGRLRAENGHPAPFHLKYVEIGNENGGPAYNERYAVFYRAIKEKYPEIITIANLWGGLPTNSPIEIIDEHYYSTPAFFIQNANRYDRYDRQGPKIYVGEYAVTQNGGQGNLKAALGEAAFMCGMERNSDVVTMSSYAPLFANVNYKRWNPDLINFDSSRVYGTPSYYVQQLFAANRPEVIVPVEVRADPLPQEPPRGAIGLGTWNTQAEYKDIMVTKGGQVLFAAEAPQNLEGWRVFGGEWKAQDSALRQTARGDDRRIIAGKPDWSDYQLSLKARKISGAEGFLVMFNVQDDQNWFWWNIGGWDNSRHAIERCEDGGKSTVGREVQGRVETGRWYDVRVELLGTRIRCFLDGELVHEADTISRLEPLHAVAGKTGKAGEIVLKVVNVANTPYETRVQLPGVRRLQGKASQVVLTSGSPTDENTLTEPRKVAPIAGTCPVTAPGFTHVFPANSLTVLRLRAD